MATPKKQVEDAFWSSGVGFVCVPLFTDAQLPGASAVSEPLYHDVLSRSGHVPDLNGAPLASWVLARVGKLASRRFPYHHGQVFGSDGGDFWLRFVAFTPEFRPLGTLSLTGDELTMKLWAQISPPSDPKQVIASFTECLLAQPRDLRSTQLTVIYTDFADPNHWKRLPFVFGWDGNQFLGHHAPEHAVSPEDIERDQTK
jgi:hypothetical protein